MGNFIKDMHTGKIGEEVVISILEEYEEVEFIMDVSDEKPFQKVDIDLLLFTNKGYVVPVEVKTDTMAHRTGNFVYEVYSSKTKKTQGCFEKTKSQYIFYFLKATKEVYAIETKKYRQYVEENCKGKQKLIKMGDNAEGYLVKIKDLVEHEVAHKLTN